MNVNLLIDAIVRQTTVLIATLATAGGSRAPLAHLADRVFADLVRELKEQGIGNKVIADMFGLALRTYHNQVSRLSESRTHGGRSLWSAVLAHVQERGVVSRADVLARFKRDDEALVRAVLKDLVASGLVFRSGIGDSVAYRAASAEDMAANGAEREAEARAKLVLVAVHRYGPISRQGIFQIVPMPDAQLAAALEQLVASGRVTAEQQQGETLYGCDSILIPPGDSAGWEAAVFDHYQAMVTALCTKVRKRVLHADMEESVGGSTYTFDLWDGHPFCPEVYGFLQATRSRGRELRERLERYNASHPSPETNSSKRVIAYVGQTVLEEDVNGDD